MPDEDVQREQLVALRERLRVPQQAAAAAVGVDRSQYSRWESGYHKFPDLVVNKIACFLVEEWRKQNTEAERLIRAYRVEQYALQQAGAR